MKLFHKTSSFQISKISFVHACQHCWVSLWQPIFKIVRWTWHKLLDKMLLRAFKPYKTYSDITVASGIASCTETTGHMPMFTQKLSNIFHFFDSDQISDMCNFGVSIGFYPLLDIVWIKQCLFWRFEWKFHAHLMKLFHKMYKWIFKFPKFLFVHVPFQHCWVGLWQPIFKIVHRYWNVTEVIGQNSYWAFKPYKSYILHIMVEIRHRDELCGNQQVTCLCLLKN